MKTAYLTIRKVALKSVIPIDYKTTSCYNYIENLDYWMVSVAEIIKNSINYPKTNILLFSSLTFLFALKKIA